MWIQKNIQFVISRDDKIRLSVAIVYLIILPVLNDINGTSKAPFKTCSNSYMCLTKMIILALWTYTNVSLQGRYCADDS